MAELLRIKAAWAGFPGAPGYSVFHMRDFEGSGDVNGQALEGAEKVRAFFEAIKLWLAPGVTVTSSGEVEIIEDTTGQLVDVASIATPGIVTSTASSTDRYAAAVGAVVTWRTGSVRNGRRIRGRTFLVPLAGNSYDNNGTLHADSRAAITTAATTLRATGTSPDLGVYARPTAPGATDGEWAVTTSFSVPDMGAVLRSRRD
jgi:hypothetical protein